MFLYITLQLEWMDLGCRTSIVHKVSTVRRLLPLQSFSPKYPIIHGALGNIVKRFLPSFLSFADISYALLPTHLNVRPEIIVGFHGKTPAILEWQLELRVPR